ncbi:MAG: hypothetical protein WCL21_06910 [Mariniphaga sp.]
MAKKILYSVAILMGLLLFNGCKQEVVVPDFSQPIVDRYVDKGSEATGGDIITTGPLKDYESDSEVVYKIVVSSKKPLSKFSVVTNTDAISQLSRVVKTIPDGVIDPKGNFTKSLNEVVIFYAFHIHPLVAPLSQVTLTFNVLNSNNYATSVYHTFTVIKKGSTDGKLLNVIDFRYTNIISRGIGEQERILDESEGMRPEAEANNSGPLFSFKYKFGFTNDLDGISMADDIDLIGYRAWVAGTSPVLVASNFYLCSPSDSVVLMTAYAGATAASIQLTGLSGTANVSLAGITSLATFRTNTTTTASDFVTANKTAYANIGLTLSASGARLTWIATKPSVGFEQVKVTPLTTNLDGLNAVDKTIRKNLIMRYTVRAMAQKLKSAGKSIRVVNFKRLDNIVGTNRVTPADFDILTHDNEFDILLAGIQAGGLIRTDALNLDQVYGFVMSDGKRGLFRTQGTVVFVDGVNVAVPLPNAGSWNLYGVIKYQSAK